MNDLSSLERRLSEIRDKAAGHATEERLGVEAEMRRVAPLRARFEGARESWMNEVVLPRLHALARSLPHEAHVEHRSGGVDAAMKCGWNKEAGLSASLTVSISPKSDFDRAVVHVMPLFVPILVGNPPPSSRELEITARTPVALAEFLDDEIAAFAEAYFETREPTSPYQRECFSIDPVCGMTVHHASAAAALQHEDRRYYFCATSCADQFRADPDRYTQVLPMKRGGPS